MKRKTKLTRNLLALLAALMLLWFCNEMPAITIQGAWNRLCDGYFLPRMGYDSIVRNPDYSTYSSLYKPVCYTVSKKLDGKVYQADIYNTLLIFWEADEHLTIIEE